VSRRRPHRARYGHDDFIFTTLSPDSCPPDEFVRRPIHPVARTHPPSHDALTAWFAPRDEFVSRRSHRLVAHAMSLFSRPHPPCSAPQVSCVASTLPPLGRPSFEFVVPRSQHSVARVMSLSCPRSHHPVARVMSLSCARPDARLPELETVRHLVRDEIAPAGTLPRSRSPDPRDSLRRTVSRAAIAAPFMARVCDAAASPGFPNDEAARPHEPAQRRRSRARLPRR
jgi:hypothetical protein